MKAFVASVVAAIVIALVAWQVLERLPSGSQDVYQSPNNTTRL